jgi:hypothetical protein
MWEEKVAGCSRRPGYIVFAAKRVMNWDLVSLDISWNISCDILRTSYFEVKCHEMFSLWYIPKKKWPGTFLIYNFIRFSFLTVASMKMTVFWGVVPRSVEEVYWHCRGACYLHHKDLCLPDYIVQHCRRHSSLCITLFCCYVSLIYGSEVLGSTLRNTGWSFYLCTHENLSNLL